MSILDSKAATWGTVAAVGLIGFYLIGRSTTVAVVETGKQAAAAVGEAVNPVSDQNIFYRGVNAVGGALSGQGGGWSLGGWIYDKLNPETATFDEMGQ